MIDYRTHKNIIRNIIIGFIVYSVVLLFIGRNLAFLPEFKAEPPKPKAEDIRKNVLEKFLKAENKSYSIYYKDLKTGDEFGIDENKVLTAASINKLPIVAYLYNKAAKKGIDLQDQITIQEEDVQDYGTGSIRYQEPGASYSLKTLTKLALEQSDNTAAFVLGVRLDKNNIQKYMESLGLKATKMEENETSAYEMGQLLEMIYNKKITNSALTAELLDFMKDTDFEDRLARDLPKNVKVYHKAADGVGFVHDVGIIDDGKNAYVLAVMTSEVKNVEESKATIGKVAKFIYEQNQKAAYK